MDFTPSDEQQRALDAMAVWYGRGFHEAAREPFVLSGLAGTGKTSLLPLVPALLGVPVRYVTPTWKAADVLTRKLRAAGVPSQATSIHNLIYVIKGVKHDPMCSVWADTEGPPVWDNCDMDCKELAFQYDPDKEPVPGIVVVDEASMVDKTVQADLALLGVPIIYSGDNGQLPPIRGGSIFKGRALDGSDGLPGYRLTKIQRQAKDSPIIRWAWNIRAGRDDWRREVPFVTAFDLNQERDGFFSGETIIIAYQNATVDKINTAVRRNAWGPDAPDLMARDRIVFRDNDQDIRVFNGQAGTVLDPGIRASEIQATGPRFNAVVEMQDGRTVRNLRIEPVASGLGDSEWQMGFQRVNHGYGLTCHRAQGSEFRRVLVWLDTPRASEDRQWLYTAATRAREELVFR